MQETAILISSFTFPALTQTCQMSETFPFQAKRKGKSEISHGMTKVFCFILQSAFRISRVNLHIENVCGRFWCITATSTVVILSTPTCRLSAQKTGVCCKMSSGTNKNIHILLWKNFLVISEIPNKIFKRWREKSKQMLNKLNKIKSLELLSY